LDLMIDAGEKDAAGVKIEKVQRQEQILLEPKKAEAGKEKLGGETTSISD